MTFAALAPENPLGITLRQAQDDFSLDTDLTLGDFKSWNPPNLRQIATMPLTAVETTCYINYLGSLGFRVVMYS
jgi:hypothetical protein